MRLLTAPIVMLVLYFVPVPHDATGQTLPDASVAADRAFKNGDWRKAVEGYKSLVVREPTNAVYWSRLGFAYHSLEEFRDAIEAYKRAEAINSSPATMYNIACAYSRLNDKESGLHWLERSAAAGLSQPGQLLSDGDLAGIRSEPRFNEILVRVQQNAAPCAEDSLHRQFDFWIGEWNVRNRQGNPMGQSIIQEILSGCVILENWAGATGYEGKSFNFVDPVTGKWRQTWVDSRGGKIEFAGTREGGTMVFFADVVEQGKEFRRRLTFFDLGPDSVRQFSERTYDDGGTWHTEYDFIYERKKP